MVSLVGCKEPGFGFNCFPPPGVDLASGHRADDTEGLGAIRDRVG